MYRTTGYLFVAICTVAFHFLAGLSSFARSQNEVLIFSVIGDVPYEASEDSILQQQILEHNLYSPSDFLVHVGDIKPNSDNCPETDYTKVVGFLQELKVPTFVLPGDNEWTDCSDPDEAWSFWTQHFTNFEQNFCGAPSVERQAVRPENLAYVTKGVLIIGLNMPGGSNSLIGNGAQRLQDNADWVNQQFSTHGPDVRAAVVFAQSLRDPDAPFEDQFLVDVVNFGKPVLYAMGEHHEFNLADPYRVDNLTKVIVDQGGVALPLQVTVTLDTLNPFLFERVPWTSSSTPFNNLPCVDAGSDQLITSSDVLSLDGTVDDDGVPTAPGSLVLAWTKVSGPGSVVFGNPASSTTTAAFSAEGNYVVKLTADDGALTASDELTVTVVNSGQSTVTVNPVHDARVRSSDPDDAAGEDTILKVRMASNDNYSFLKFDLTGLSGTVLSAKVRLVVVDGGPDGGAIHSVSNSYQGSSDPWVESLLTWNNAPQIGENPLSAIGAVSAGEVVEFDVTAAITGSGTYSFAIENSSSDAVDYSSKEGSSPPELVLDIQEDPVPTIFSFTPASGPQGTEVTLSGTKFSNATSVTFDNISVSFQVDSNTQLRAEVPAAAGTGRIAVTDTDGTGESAQDFVVIVPPVLTSFSPSSGFVGDEVTLAGNGFLSVESISFSGTPAVPAIDSDAQLRATVPAGAGSGPISITNPAGTVASGSSFTVLQDPVPPIISSFVASSGPVGSQITITGSGFASATEVSFNGTSASFSIDSDTQVMATVPAGATNGAITIDNGDGTGTSTSDFTVTESPGETFSFAPTDDAYIIISQSDNNYGSGTTLRVKKTAITSYLKFNVVGLTAAVHSAQLRLFVTEGSPDGGSVFSISNSFAGGSTVWTEGELIPTNAPEISGTPLSSAGSAVTSTTVEFDVTDAVTSNGIISFGLNSNDSDLVRYSSKEGAVVPELLVTVVSSGGSNPPTISSFSPASGAVGDEVTILGANFSGVTGVSFNGSSALVFAVDSDTQLRVDVPAGATSGSLSVTNASGTGDSGDAFTVLQPPTISSFLPSNGVVGAEVTITGSELSNVTAVTFNGTAVVGITVDSETLIRANVPVGASAGPIHVSNAAGSATSATDFVVLEVPVILSFSPDSGPIGNEVTIAGSEFAAVTEVLFNGVSTSSLNIDSDSELRAVVPTGATSGKIRLVHPDSTVESSDDFTVIDPPVIAGFSPATGVVGTEVTITGSELSEVTAVIFAGMAAEGLSVDSDATIRVEVPTGASTGSIVITNLAGSDTSTTDFVVLQVPVIVSFTPNSGPIGTEVTVTGSEFTGTTDVLFSGLSATSLSIDSNTQLRAVVPSGATDGKIRVVHPDSTAESASDFTVINLPAITGFSPASGPIGSEVTVTGVNLDQISSVSFDGTTSTGFAIDSDLQLRANVPSGATSGAITVTNAAGTAASQTIFSVAVSSGRLVFNPTDDARVRSSRPNTNYGDDEFVKVKTTSAFHHSYFKFVVTGLSGSAQAAKVRLVVTKGGQEGGEIRLVSNDYLGTTDPWLETGLFWNNAPELSGIVLSALGSVGKNDTVEFDVTSAITGSGIYSFGLRTNSGDEVEYSSKEGSFAPELVIEASTSSSPVISSFIPSAGVIGDEVTIAGSNFSGTTEVFFDGTPAANFEVDSDSQVRAEVPFGATTGTVAVTNAAGTSTSSEAFTVIVPPIISGFSPESGVVGTEVTLTGSDLTDVGEVAFNGIAAADFTVDSETSIRANVPAGASTGPIVISNVAGSDTSATDLVVLEVPVIVSFTPNSGPIGTEVTLTGSEFAGVTEVLFNGVSSSSLNIDSDSELRAVVPTGATSGKIRVVHPDSTVESSDDFTVIDPPVIAGFSPASGVVGTEVTLTGSDLADVTGVRFNSIAAADFTVDSETLIRANVPAGASTGPIEISNVAGSDTSATDFVVLEVPVIVSFTPNSGPIGTEVTLTGSEFAGVTEVLFNGVSSSSLNVDSDSELRAVVPTGATSGKIRVVHPDSTVESSDDFTVIDPPVISGFSPASGVVGTEVTLTGSNLAEVTEVFFNGTLSENITVDSDSQVRAQAPVGASSGTISLSNASGSVTSATDFIVLEVPSIASFSPSSGAEGAEVTIVGSTFSGVTDVLFNGVSTNNLNVDSDTELHAEVPTGATSGKLRVVHPDSTVESSDDFTVVFSPSVISFTPTTGQSGTEVIIIGSNLDGTDNVLFNGTPASSFVIDSNTQLRAEAPNNASTGVIEVFNAAGSALTTEEFQVTSDPGTLVLHPIHDARVRSNEPNKNYESDLLKIREAGALHYSFLKFDLSGLSGSVLSAKLRLLVLDGGPEGGTVHPVSNNYEGDNEAWDESGITWNNAPAIDSDPLDSLGSVDEGDVVEFDVSEFVTGSGIFSFGLKNPSSDVVDYSSKEGDFPPELVIEKSTSIPEVSSFSPAEGAVGTEVTILGDNLSATTLVTIGGTSSVFSIDSDSRVTAEVPAGAISGKIFVANSDGNAQGEDDFIVLLPPVIASFSPTSGPVGEQVTVFGSGFDSVSEVALNSTVASFTVISDGELRFSVPSGETSGGLRLTSPGGTTISTSIFQVIDTASISSFIPSAGVIGDEVTIAGSNLSGTTEVSFDGTPAAIFEVDSDSQVRAEVPFGATTGTLAVTNAAGTSTSSEAFTVIVPPIISGFSPASGVVGTEVTLTGSDLADVTGVRFNGIAAADFTVDSETSIRANVPAGASTGPIVISNVAGSDTSATDLVVLEVPVIVSFTPNSGPIGTEVTLTGSEFAGVTEVLFNGVSSSSLNIDSDSELRAVVPAGAASGKIRLVHPDSTVESSDDFTVIDPPTIASFNPTSGTVGAEVTIIGSNLSGATDVVFNGISTSNLNIDSDIQLRAIVPNSSTGNIIVVVTDGAAESSEPFTVLSTPTISSFTPTSGPPGTEVVILGGDLSRIDTALFNGTVSGSVVVESNTELRAVVPADATSGPIELSGLAGSVTTSQDFDVVSGQGSLVFTPLDDSRVRSSNPTTNYGDELVLKVRRSAAHHYSFMKFDLSGLSQTILSAKIRLVVVEGGPDGGRLHPVSNSYQGSSTLWDEDGLIWDNAPIIDSDDLGSVGAVNAGDVIEFDVSAAVTSSDLYSFALKNASSDPVDYSSKEGNSPPELIVQVPTTSLPIVSSFEPSEGIVGGDVTIIGANFLSATQVTIGGTPAAFTIDADRQIIAQIPAGAISGTISVTNLDGAGASPEVFTVVNPPIISGFSPAGGPMGAEVTVTGDNLLQVTQVLFNGTLADFFTIDSNSVLRADVPVGAGSGPIVLSNIAGSIASTANFAVSQGAVIVSFSPISGVVGTEVTILGNGLDEATDVFFSGVTASSFDVDSDAQIRAVVPSGAPSGTISADHPDGLLESEDLFAVVRNPGITGFSPLNGGVGTEVTLTGNNLLGVSDVFFAGTATSIFTADSESLLRAEVPSGAITGRITISNIVGSDSTDFEFGLILPPTIRSFTPPCGPVDTEVTITGTDFETGVTVTFNGIAASGVIVDSDTEVLARVPSEFASGEVVVTNGAGSAAALSDFTVQDGCYSFVTTDDGYTRSGEPTQNNGNDHDLKVKSGSSGERITYLKFSVTGVVGSIQSAKVRLFVQKGSSSGGSIYPVSNNYEGTTDPWDELGLVWLNAPQISGSPLFTLGEVVPGVEVELDVTPAITGNGVFSFAIQNDIGQLAEYSSNNRTTDGSDPLLTIITGGGTVSSDEATFNPTDDAFVRSTDPDKNYERSSELRLRQSSTVFNSYLKFNVSGLTGPVQNAVIRMHVIDAGPDGGSIFSVSNIYPGSGVPWTEADLTFNNAPPITGEALSIAGQAELGATIEFDVTQAIVGNGVYSFGISNQSSSTMKYSSKDGVEAPELVIIFGSGGGSASPPLISSFTPSTGTIGSTVTISGSDLTGATSVLFNDVASAFNVASDIQIQTTVPGDATTGKIRVTTPAGSATSIDSFLVTNTNPSGSESVIFTPTHDTFARESEPTTIYGAASAIRVKNQDHIGYLKFEVTGLATVFSATLRLEVTDPSLDGGSVYLAENTFRDTSTPWTEGGVIWSNRPNITGEALSTVGVGVVGDTIDFDVSTAITGNGTYSFALFDASSDAIYYSSKDGPAEPILVVQANTSASKLTDDDETENGESVESSPVIVQLYPAYPSPFNVQTIIRYDLPDEAHVKLFVYNTLGQEVRELVNEIQTAGIKRIRWEGKNNSGYDAASGTYFVRLNVAGKVMTRKIVLQK